MKSEDPNAALFEGSPKS